MKKIIINNLCKISNLALLTLPLLYGCNGSGSEGGSASAGSLLTPGTSVGTGTTLLASVPDAVVSSGIPVVHNPEPATMLLLGGGMMAMGFVKSRIRARKHS